jgi:hypothetical protein
MLHWDSAGVATGVVAGESARAQATAKALYVVVIPARGPSMTVAFRGAVLTVEWTMRTFCTVPFPVWITGNVPVKGPASISSYRAVPSVLIDTEIPFARTCVRVVVNIWADEGQIARALRKAGVKIAPVPGMLARYTVAW